MMPVARLIDVPELVTPPPACLTALRGLSPRLEVVCLLPNVWWIGEVKPTGAAQVEGQNRLGQLHRRLARGGHVRPVAFFKARLMAQGFRMLTLVTSPILTPSQCVLAVAPCLRATPKSIDRAWDAGLREADGTNRREATNKWIREEYAVHHGRDAHRHAFHRPIISIPEKTP